MRRSVTTRPSFRWRMARFRPRSHEQPEDVLLFIVGRFHDLLEAFQLLSVISISYIHPSVCEKLDASTAAAAAA